MTHEEFIAEIEKMTVLELNDLVKAGKVRVLGASAMYGYQF